MNVVGARQRFRVHYDHRAQEHQLPLGPLARHICQEADVQPFVEYPEETQSWVRERALVSGIGEPTARARKVLDVDRTGEEMAITPYALFRMIETLTSNRDQVGPLQEEPLEFDQRRRCSPKGREFVHAVVDHCAGRK